MSTPIQKKTQVWYNAGRFAFENLDKLGMLNEIYFLNVRLGKRSTNCNGGCKTENATYKRISEEVKESEGRKDEIILIDIKR